MFTNCIKVVLNQDFFDMLVPPVVYIYKNMLSTIYVFLKKILIFDAIGT